MLPVDNQLHEVNMNKQNFVKIHDVFMENEQLRICKSRRKSIQKDIRRRFYCITYHLICLTNKDYDSTVCKATSCETRCPLIPILMYFHRFSIKNALTRAHVSLTVHPKNGFVCVNVFYCFNE